MSGFPVASLCLGKLTSSIPHIQPVPNHVSSRNITTIPHRILHAQSLQYLQSLYPPQLHIPHYSYILRIRNLNLQPPPQFLLNLRVRLRTPLIGYPFNACQLTSGHGVIHGVHVYGRLAFSRVRNGLLHRKAKVRVRNCGAKPAPLTDFTSSVIFALKIRNY